jgi:hypothetical protein
MKSIRFAVPVAFLGLVSCSTPTANPAPVAGAVKYRYENTLDVRNDNTLDHVVATGYDERNLGEVTRLDVSAGGAALSLRNASDTNGAMYTPSVELTKQGTLLVSWGEIGDAWCKVELSADAAGNLTVKSRKQGAY